MSIQLALRSRVLSEMLTGVKPVPSLSAYSGVPSLIIVL
jgi:hypothetical protein